ncbi:acyl-CoA dehydrogenase family protein [Bacillus marinisedimentorum]|uniref:acyl-CoA dehydrogenase family protein n=1 Tax=Bacillus marinisedimentorum TaxID=1821260 RepID=UPI0007DF920A|nr:acyl-CoA dehydrogenase family protein [Bacillus marinisedimentorum]
MFDAYTIDMIRGHSRKMEKAGELPPDVLDIIYDRGLFKLFLPAELNGRMMPFPMAVKLFEEAAWIDGSFGWLVQIGSGAGFFATTISPAFAPDVFSRRDAYIAGSDRPNGVANKVDAGWRVTGSWPFCSGSLHATTFTANCRVEVDGVEDGAVRAFILRPGQVEIEKDWNAFGLKATNSHTIHVKDAFVPEERTFDVFKPHFHYDNPVYHYPFVPFAEANIAATTIGIARHFFEEAQAHAERKLQIWDQERYSFVIRKIEQLTAPFDQSAAAFHKAIETSWQSHLAGNALSDEEMIDISVHSKEAARHAVEGAQNLFRYMGIDVLFEDNVLNRTYRDLLTASQHKLLISYGD